MNILTGYISQLSANAMDATLDRCLTILRREYGCCYLKGFTEHGPPPWPSDLLTRSLVVGLLAFLFRLIRNPKWSQTKWLG
jgi:hypothetical protein